MITIAKGSKVSATVFRGNVVDADDLTATWNVSGFWLADIMTAGLVSRREDVLRLSGMSNLAYAAMDSVEGGHLFEEVFAILDARVPTAPGTVAIRFTVDVTRWWEQYGDWSDPYGYKFDHEYGPNRELGEFDVDADGLSWEHDDD